MPDIWPNLPLEQSKNENLVWKLHFLIVQEVNLAEYPAVKPNLRLLPDAWQQPDLMIFGRRTSGRRIGRVVGRRFCRRKIRFNTGVKGIAGGVMNYESCDPKMKNLTIR